MKKRLLLLLILITAGFSLPAQVGWKCGTPSFQTLNPNHSQILQHHVVTRSGADTLYIPVTVHLLGTNMGTGYYSIEMTFAALCKLQSDFGEYGFHFYLENLNYINNSIFNNMSSSYVFSDAMYQFIENQNTQNTMNVYVVQSAGGYSFVSAKDFDWDYFSYPPPQIFTQAQSIVMAKNHLNTYDHLFTHEVGHFLGLYHTFEGANWNHFSVNGTPDSIFYSLYDPVNDTTLQLYWLVERADSINCDISGDLICDTHQTTSLVFSAMPTVKVLPSKQTRTELLFAPMVLCTCLTATTVAKTGSALGRWKRCSMWQKAPEATCCTTRHRPPNCQLMTWR